MEIIQTMEMPVRYFIKSSIIIASVLFNFNVYAAELSDSETQELAIAYQPILELHEDEYYAPINVDNIASNPNTTPPVVLHRDGYEDIIMTETNLDYLTLIPGVTPSSFIDLPVTAYEDMEKTYTVYYRVFYNQDNVYPYAIQYWFFYYRNRWGAVVHEGDWESITIFLDNLKQAKEVALSTHYEAHRYAWSNSILTKTGNRLHVYVSEGGHGSYAYPGETWYDSFPDWPDAPGNWTGQYDHHEGNGADISDYWLVNIKAFEDTDNWLNFKGTFGDYGNTNNPLLGAGPQSPLLRTDAPNMDLWEVAINAPSDPYDECKPRTEQQIYGTYDQSDGDEYGPWRWAQGYPLNDSACQPVPSVLPTNLTAVQTDNNNQISFSWEDSEWDTVHWYLITISNINSTEISRTWVAYNDQNLTCSNDTCNYLYNFTGAEGTYYWTVKGANNGGNGDESDAGTFAYVVGTGVAVDNNKPVAQIVSSSSSVNISTLVTLDGSSSYDPDGDSIAGSYSWELTSPNGSVSQLSSTTGSLVSFTPDIEGSYSVKLSVSDGEKTGVTQKTITAERVYEEAELIEIDEGRFCYRPIDLGTCDLQHLDTITVPSDEIWKEVTFALSRNGHDVILLVDDDEIPSTDDSFNTDPQSNDCMIGYVQAFDSDKEWDLSVQGGFPDWTKDLYPGDKLRISVFSYGGIDDYEICVDISIDKDVDADGVPDDKDAFPNDPTEQYDTDGDGVGDNTDSFPNDPAAYLDNDGDGYPDAWITGKSESDSTTGLTLDTFPGDSEEWLDNDNDGVGDNTDMFDDDASASLDSDGDGYPDEWNSGKSGSDSTTGLQLDKFINDPAAAIDDDNDGHPDRWNLGKSASDSTTGLTLDLFPEDQTEWADSDYDGVGDNSDWAPNDQTEWVDSDGDGIGDNADVAPNDPNRWSNSAPVIESITPQTISEGDSVQLQLVATDADNDPLQFDILSALSFINVNESTLEISPEYGDVGEYETIVRVTDSFGEIDSIIFNISVTASTKQDQSISFYDYPSTLEVGKSGNLSATATSGLSVTFSSKTNSICTVSGSTVNAISQGTCTIAANQDGDSTYKPAPEVTQNTDVIPNKQDQTISFISYPSSLEVGNSGNLSAAATSGLSVRFSSTTNSICTVSGTTVNAVSQGTCTVAANQDGSSTYNPAPEVTRNIGINKPITPVQSIPNILFLPAILSAKNTITEPPPPPTGNIYYGKYSWNCSADLTGESPLWIEFKELDSNTISGTITYLNSTTTFSGIRCSQVSYNDTFLPTCLNSIANGKYLQFAVEQTNTHVNNSFFGEIDENEIIGKTLNGDSSVGSYPGCSHATENAGVFRVKKN